MYIFFFSGVDDSAEKFGLDEFISIITFGKSTAILQPFTNTYTSIRGVVENSLGKISMVREM